MISSELTESEFDILNERGHESCDTIGQGTYAKVVITKYISRRVQKEDWDEPPIMEFACKIIDTQFAPSEFTHKFLPRALEMLVKIRHPHIIRVHGAFQRGYKYLVMMRLAERGDLLEHLTDNGPLAEGEACSLVRQIALALQYLHTLDIAHRNLNCENILITENMNAKLTGFGLARFVDEAKYETSTTFCGLPAYAAPELIKGLEYKPKPVDLWALGCVLFIMINCRLPFDTYNPRLAYEQQMSRKMRFNGETMVSPQLKLLVYGLLDPDVETRHTIDRVLESDWFYIDNRYIGMSWAERKALDRAKKNKMTVRDKESETSTIQEVGPCGQCLMDDWD